MLRSLEADGAAGLLPPGRSAGFCAVDGDGIVATVVHSVGRPIVHVWGFYVLPSHQRRGLGMRLMQAVRDATAGAPIECRVLETSRAAVAFYRAIGFEIVGRDEGEILRGVEAVCLVMRDRR